MIHEIRLLLAVLRDVRRHGRRPAHTLETAAKSNTVDPGRLALELLEKVVAVQRARASLAGLAEADPGRRSRRGCSD